MSWRRELHYSWGVIVWLGGSVLVGVVSRVGWIENRDVAVALALAAMLAGLIVGQNRPPYPGDER